MADIECPHCGHRALRVATRCPRCGADIPAELREAAARPEPGRLRPLMFVGAGLAAVIVVGAIVRGGEGGGAAPGPIDPTPAPADSAPVVVPTVTADTTPPDSAPPGPPPSARPTAARLERRFATTWINLRAARSGAAAIVRILQPGEAVLVDSLGRGWYRVVADGRTEGYAHRRYLSTERPGDSGTQ